MSTTLMSVSESADVFVDACVRSDAGELLLLSVFGRDTAILALYAAFSLPSGNGGIRALHVQNGATDVEVRVSEPQRLEKMTARLPKDNLFGNVTHTWLYDPVAIAPDRANRRALLLKFNESDALFNARIWSHVKLLSPVPLMDHWRSALIDGLGSELVTRLEESASPPVGAVSGCRIRLDDRFERFISIAVASGALTLLPEDMPADAAAQIAQVYVVSEHAEPEASELGESVLVPAGPQLFSPGQVGATCGVHALAELGINVQALILRVLRRHLAGDWGAISPADARENNQALTLGNRLFSAYVIDEANALEGCDRDQQVWVITEADRSVTTVLLPSEY